MSVKIIVGYKDLEFDENSDTFYANFAPDDWDYIVIGDDKFSVEVISDRLAVMDYEMKQIRGKYWAVCYHS